MSLKNEIEKEMFTESLDDRIQDIASLIDSPVEDVQKRMKTLNFSDYIKVMSALKSMIISRFSQKNKTNFALLEWDNTYNSCFKMINDKKASLFVIYNNNEKS